MYSDVDKDGDNDIIYRMDNSLYLKENTLAAPEMNHFSDSPRVENWQNFLYMAPDPVGGQRILAAPNHFGETFVTSNEINFSFRPANFLLDNLFRFEYYDYINRFDRITSGENPLAITPTALVHKIDLIPDLSEETVSDTTQVGFV